MKNSISFICLFCTFTLLVISSHASPSIPYKIKGELISMFPEVSAQDESETDTDKTETSTEEEVFEPVDLSDAILTISYTGTNDEGEVEPVILVEEHFDGTFDYFGVTDEPTEVTISLKVSEDAEPIEIDSVIGNGRDIHFALVDDPGWDLEITLIGTASYTLDPEKKFTISGDLSFLGTDLDETTVYLNWKEFDDEGNSQNRRATLWMHNDSFVIEGDTEIPQVAELWVLGVNIPDVFVNFDVVLEPKGEYIVSQLGNQKDEFGVSSGSRYHTMLIDSWQQQEDYLGLKARITQENERLQELIESGTEDSETELSDQEIVAASADNKVQAVAVSTTSEPAEGCEDAVTQPEEVSQPSKVVQHQALRSKIAAMVQELDDRRTNTMKEIAERHKDPMARYLAVRLNPWERREYSPRISILRELEKVMEADFVSVHITPLIGRMEQSALKASNDSRLIAGQKVPEFNLVSFEGEDVSLFDVLEERDFVLIDFWASWCGPCIADFPELKKLYSAYNDDGFEIVGVSIDDNMEDWKESVDEHELPWVNLGELKDWDGPVAVGYGVNAIPKGYLVDSQGCIYEKNIRPRALKDFLVKRYGMDESLEAPEVDTDSDPDVSS